jgi:Bacterial capsule synthesis protein PGA_cap
MKLLVKSWPKSSLLVMLFGFSGLLLVAAVAVNLYPTWQNSPKNSTPTVIQPITEPAKTKKQQPKPIQLRLNSMFFGDVFWGRYIDDWSKKSELKTAYPFSGLSTLDRNKYDAWIADLECPVTDMYLDSATQDNLLKFSCPAEYAPEAAKWFDAFTLANNHVDNMQEIDGLNKTRQYLEKNGIQYFGHYDNSVKEDLCEVVSLKARPVFETEVETDEEYFVPLALCGYHNVFQLPKDDELEVISQHAKYFPTIVMPHQGQEYKTVHDQLQQSVYRRMIDLGADAVIGNHPHTVQDSEAYKGKLIIYSLGNFIFDQQSGPLVRTGVGANLDFNFKFDVDLEKWQTVAKNCQAYKDECLSQAKSQDLAKPKWSIKYDVVATDNANKLAKKAEPEIQSQIRARLNWDKTLAGLNQLPIPQTRE